MLYEVITALSQTVYRAREVVGDDGERQSVLRTEHGRGFQFVARVSVVPVADTEQSTLVHPRTHLVAVAVAAALVLLV